MLFYFLVPFENRSSSIFYTLRNLFGRKNLSNYLTSETSEFFLEIAIIFCICSDICNPYISEYREDNSAPESHSEIVLDSCGESIIVYEVHLEVDSCKYNSWYIHERWKKEVSESEKKHEKHNERESYFEFLHHTISIVEIDIYFEFIQKSTERYIFIFVRIRKKKKKNVGEFVKLFLVECHSTGNKFKNNR